MKRLLFILVSTLFYMNCLAKEMPIQLYKDTSNIRVIDKRSLSVEPTATYDENTICIYLNMAVENVSIVIKDKYDNIVYSNDSITVSQCHTFKVYDLPEGDYVLVFGIGDDSFYGYFSYQNNI